LGGNGTGVLGVVGGDKKDGKQVVMGFYGSRGLRGWEEQARRIFRSEIG